MASSFSAIARSFSTAIARRWKVASSARCWIASRVGWRSAFSTSALGATSATRTATSAIPSSWRAGSARRPRSIRWRIGATPRVQDRAHVELAQLVDDELLGELAQQAGDLLERGLRPAARREVEREVHAPGERGRLGDPEGDHALDGELLEVRAAHAEQERQLAVVDRDLGDGGVDRAEPERQPGAVAAQVTPAVAEDVVGRLAAEVAEERISLDGGHAEILL